jgi:hypothetical protein
MTNKIIDAMRKNESIPDLIAGSTKGDLVNSYYKNR